MIGRFTANPQREVPTNIQPQNLTYDWSGMISISRDRTATYL
jgi:hypothetical protein